MKKKKSLKRRTVAFEGFQAQKYETPKQKFWQT